MRETGALKVFQGPEYIILDTKYSKMDNKIRENIITVSCGGSDKKGFLYSVVRKLVKYDFKKIFVIVGSGVRKENKINKFYNEKVKLIINETNLKKYFSKSKFSIISGGTVMFESIASKVRTIVIQNYNHQKFAINYFKKKNNIIYAGNLKEFKSNLKINSFLKSAKKIKFNNIVDGKGLIRSQNIILEYIKK